MAAMDDVTRDVVAIIAKKLRDRKGELRLDERLDEIGLDSFAAVEMIFDLEEKFDIQIPYNSNDARMDFETVGDVVDAIKKRIGQS
jgi:acyl carrier protein